MQQASASWQSASSPGSHGAPAVPGAGWQVAVVPPGSMTQVLLQQALLLGLPLSIGHCAPFGNPHSPTRGVPAGQQRFDWHCWLAAHSVPRPCVPVQTFSLLQNWPSGQQLPFGQVAFAPAVQTQPVPSTQAAFAPHWTGVDEQEPLTQVEVEHVVLLQTLPQAPQFWLSLARSAAVLQTPPQFVLPCGHAQRPRPVASGVQVWVQHSPALRQISPTRRQFWPWARPTPTSAPAAASAPPERALRTDRRVDAPAKDLANSSNLRSSTLLPPTNRIRKNPGSQSARTPDSPTSRLAGDDRGVQAVARNAHAGPPDDASWRTTGIGVNN
jgi:hypothetical protein